MRNDLLGAGPFVSASLANSYRLYPRLEATPRIPDDGDVEDWFEYAFSRNATALKAFNERMYSVQKQLAVRREED